VIFTSLSEMLIKLGGIVLFVVGIALVLSLVGLSFFGLAVSLEPVWAVLLGIAFIAGGIYLIRGGSISW